MFLIQLLPRNKLHNAFGPFERKRVPLCDLDSQKQTTKWNKLTAHCFTHALTMWHFNCVQPLTSKWDFCRLVEGPGRCLQLPPSCFSVFNIQLSWHTDTDTYNAQYESDDVYHSLTSAKCISNNTFSSHSCSGSFVEGKRNMKQS